MKLLNAVRVTSLILTLVLSPAAIFAETPTADRPVWTNGSSWRYDYTVNGQKYWALHRYAGLVEENGTKHHLIQTNYWRLYYDLDLNAVSDVHVTRGVVVKYDPPFASFNWPLQVGKKWTQRTVHSGVSSSGSRSSHADEWAFEVVAYEKVRTEAGEFETFKIMARQTNNHETQDGMNYKEYWYAPAVKRIVKYELVGPRYQEKGEVTQFSLGEE